MHEFSSLAEVSDLVRRRQVSVVDLVGDCLRRIEELNPRLNAFITVTSEAALRAAHQSEAEIAADGWRGPLHGIPVAVKDFFDTAGVPTTGAFKPFRHRVPARDAEVVARLKEAGAVLVGKTNMHTLGMGTTSITSCFGAVHNPWNPAHVAGGSSGGSAAAVAAGLCFATLDTDAIGSCRLPAACCGVTGFKPTFGLLSTQGILAGEPVDAETARVLAWIGHTALTCRTAADVATVLTVLAGGAERRASSGPERPPRIGVARNYRVAAEVEEAFEGALSVFRSLRCEAVEVAAPFAAANFHFSQIEQDRAEITGSLFQEIDVLVLPTTTDLPPSIEEAERVGDPQAVAPDLTLFCNYFGLPAVSLPCGFSRHGLPIGFQVIGPPGGDGVVLGVGRSFQDHTQWHLRHP